MLQKFEGVYLEFLIMFSLANCYSFCSTYQKIPLTLLVKLNVMFRHNRIFAFCICIFASVFNAFLHLSLMSTHAKL